MTLKATFTPQAGPVPVQLAGWREPVQGRSAGEGARTSPQGIKEAADPVQLFLSHAKDAGDVPHLHKGSARAVEVCKGHGTLRDEGSHPRATHLVHVSGQSVRVGLPPLLPFDGPVGVIQSWSPRLRRG